MVPVKPTINFFTTCFMIFHTKRKKSPENSIRIKIDEIVISRVKVTKYLGLHIDENLSWDYHIIQLCKGLNRFFGIFKKNFAM